MRTEYFHAFIKVVDTGSFTKAARLLKQPISRVSRTIQALEDEIGAPLLYRTTRQLNLTQTGRALYDHIRRPLAELELALESVQGQGRDVSGLLRITAVGDLAPLLAVLVAKFRERYPRTQIELILDDRVLDLVKDSIDVSLRLGVLADSSLKSVRIGEVSGIFVASGSYLARAPALENLESLQQHSLLHFGEVPRDRGCEWKVRKVDGKIQLVKINPVYLSNHTGAILNLALNGQGVTLLPKFLCAESLRTGLLTHVLRQFETKPLPVHLLWNQNAKGQSKVRAFIEFAKAELPNTAYPLFR